MLIQFIFVAWYQKISNLCMIHWMGLREKIQETPLFHRQIYGFL